VSGQDEAPPNDIAAQLESAGSSQKRFEIMYAAVRDRISMLVYSPGMQLSEEVLAAEFGVSRSPLRKALKILEADGLLRSQQGVGTFVTDVDLQALAQVYQLRMELNELTGRLAPAPLDDTLKTRFETMRARAKALSEEPDLEAFARLNIDFFHVFQELTTNLPLRSVSERLFYQTCRIWLKHVPNMNLEKEVSIFCGEISDICDAIRIGDTNAAALIRRAHLSMGHTRLTSQFN